MNPPPRRSPRADAIWVAGEGGGGYDRRTSEPLRLLVADDHPVFREGLLRIVAARPGLELAGEAGDARHALEAIEALQPDVALLDVRMPGPGPLEVLQRARRASATTRVVFLTGYEDRDLVYAALAEGVAGFLSKAADRDDRERGLGG